MSEQLSSAANAKQAGTNRLGQDGSTYVIGFFHASHNPANGCTVGGLLLTDNTGLPLEFRITSVVKPTRSQQILYGNRLKTYAAINLCAVQLLSTIENQPRAIFVRETEMLPLYKLTNIPVLRLYLVENLGASDSQPSIEAPKERPEYCDLIDLTSLASDMLDVFDRIEKCRELLASQREDYRI